MVGDIVGWSDWVTHGETYAISLFRSFLLVWSYSGKKNLLEGINQASGVL